MGALFGFSGSPCERTRSRQDESLRHRGRGALQICHLPWGTVGARARWSDRPEQRLWSDGEAAVAVSGMLTSDFDASHFLAMGKKERIEVLRRLSGAFVLACVSREGVLVARDGAGARSVSYARHDGRWLFAVEPKGVLAAPGFPRRIRPGAVAQYLTYSFVPDDGTMLEGLFQVPAGHAVWLASDSTDAESMRLFDFESAEADAVTAEESPTDWVSRVRQEHARAVRRRLPPGEAVGAFLSGGLDSSIVVAELKKQHDAPVRTYSIHFGAEYDSELPFARAVASRLGTEHHEVEIRPREFLPRLLQIVWHLDEPIGDPITVPNFELSRRASEDSRWVFNGEGGDPLFGGPKNIPMLLAHWYGGVEHGSSVRARRYLASYRRGYEDWQRLLSPEFRSAVEPERDLEAPVQRMLDAERPRALLNKLCAINIRLKGANLILPKVDRMTAASGLVAASPLFDERLILTSFAMPPRLKLRAGIEKVALKEAYRDELPRSVIERPKSGMRVPVHHWFQRDLSRYARRLLSPRAVRRAGVFDPERVRQLLRYESSAGLGRHGIRLWMLMTFELWRRLVVEGQAP